MLFKSYKTFLLVFAVLIVSACETFDMELQENPDVLTLESADVDLLFNTVQFTFRNQMNSMGFTTDQTMRMVNQFGFYAFGAGTMNGVWSQTYTTGTQLEGLKVFAERDGFTYHYGAAQVMQAVMYLNLVDYIGSAVFTEANQPEEFPNPGLNSGEEIYAGILAMLDEGITNLQAGGRAPVNDFFGGSAADWVKFANTVKLRMALQTRLVDAGASTSTINSLVAGGELIDEIGEDFQFNYGTNGPPVESRHPLFTGNYINGAGGYQSNGFISYMKDSMSVADPRLVYYFYRQTNRDLVNENPDLVPCLGVARYDFCHVGDGYYARDHADDEGIPGDQNLRTTYGIYPAGGAFDEGQGVAALASGASGAGAFAPIHLSSWTHFMLAEAALTLGTTGNPTTYLETGIRIAMAKVRAFNPSGMTNAQIDDYVTEVLAEYAAEDAAGQLDIIIREWYLSSFTQGLLPYNNYRRTGYPSFLQDQVTPGGVFPRSLLYPESEQNSNSNPDFAQNKSLTDRVFWDTNPPGFVN